MSPKRGFFDGDLPSLTKKDRERAEEFDERESGVDGRGEKKDYQSLQKHLKIRSDSEGETKTREESAPPEALENQKKKLAIGLKKRPVPSKEESSESRTIRVSS